MTHFFSLPGIPIGSIPTIASLSIMRQATSCEVRMSTLQNHRIGLQPYFFTMNKAEAIDIDYEEDFLMAQAVYDIADDKAKSKL